MFQYFNHRFHVAENGWERREFIQNWWRLYQDDSRWTPPRYTQFKRALQPERQAHMTRMQLQCVYLDALRRQVPSRRQKEAQIPPGQTTFELPRAAAVILTDPRRRDRVAYLALPHMANDRESGRVFLRQIAERLRRQGVSRLLGPTGFSPHLSSGLLQDRWDLWPPLHTPSNPPYVPELLAGVMSPLATTRLFHLSVTAVPGETAVPSPDAPAQLHPLAPGRLATDLRPLMAAACENRFGFPLPDATEILFLLDWLGTRTLGGWMAMVDAEPVGFVLLQPDLAPLLRRTQGGRSWWRRLWLWLNYRRPVTRGRVLFGSVLPAYRRQRIGRLLLAKALAAAQERGWRTLVAGPVPESGPAASLFREAGAQPRQTYQLYEWML